MIYCRLRIQGNAVRDFLVMNYKSLKFKDVYFEQIFFLYLSVKLYGTRSKLRYSKRLSKHSTVFIVQSTSE